MTTVKLDESAAEIVGLYTGKLAALVAIMHQAGLIDGRQFASVRDDYKTELGQFFADVLRQNTIAAIDRVEGSRVKLALVQNMGVCAGKNDLSGQPVRGE